MIFPLFIISSGRSGSMSLAHTLNQVAGISACHGLVRMEKENCLRYHEVLDDLELERLIKINLYPKISEILDKGDYYIDTAWYYTNMIPALASVFPLAKFIHLVRNPYDFIRSGLAREWFTDDPAYLASENSWSRDHWEPPFFCDGRLSKIAWLWTIQQAEIETGLKKLKGRDQNKGRIKLEQIINKGVNLVLTQGDIPLHSDLELKLDNATNVPKPHWRTWEPRDLATVNSFVEHTMKEYDYDSA